MKIHRSYVVLWVALMLCGSTVVPAASAPSAAPPIVRYVGGPGIGVDAGGCDVDTASCATVQYAVDQSDAGDEIHVASGTYTDTHTLTAVPGYPTTGAITQTAVITKDLTLLGGYDPADWSAEPVSVSALTPMGRALVVLNASLRLERFQLVGGSAVGQGGVPGEPGVDAGGGLYVLGGSLTISGTSFIYGTAGPSGHGAGAYVRDGDATIIQSFFISNGLGAGSYGGGAARGGGLYVDGGTIDLDHVQWVANEAQSEGGGVYLAGSSTQIEDALMISNQAGRCGGLYVSGGATQVLRAALTANVARTREGGGGCSEDGTLDLRGSVLNGNVARTHGGGFVASGGQATFADNQFSGNIAGQTPTAGNGGGLALFGDETSAFTLTNNRFLGNIANGVILGGSNGLGGGLYALTASGTRLISNTFQSNVSFDNGCGAYFDQSDRVSAQRSAFLNNTSVGGGGALGISLSSNVALTNTLLAVNSASASSRGAGLLIIDSTAKLWHTTLYGNTSLGGSAVNVSGRSPTRMAIPPAAVSLINTIIANQSAGVVADSVGAVTLDHTLFDSTLVPTVTTGSGQIVSTASYSGTALFVSPGSDFRLQGYSAAIDKGVDAGVTDDLGGQPRPIGLAPDLGAYEFQGAIALNKVPYLDPIRSGSLVTYTIVVTNTGNLEILTGIVQDFVTPPLTAGGGPVAFGLPQMLPGAVWTQVVTMTAPSGYSGVITNPVFVQPVMSDTTGLTTGAMKVYTATSRYLTLDVIQYLPLLEKDWPDTN